MGQKSSARPPDGEILQPGGRIREPDDRNLGPDVGILKKEILGYTGICFVLLLLLGAGGMLVRTFPVRALANTLLYLAIGGLGMSACLFRFRPGAEQSEFFRTFRWLYHPGIWILAAASFLDESEIFPEKLAGNLHLAYIAGWTFLVAGGIVLVVILREGKT